MRDERYPTIPTRFASAHILLTPHMLPKHILRPHQYLPTQRHHSRRTLLNMNIAARQRSQHSLNLPAQALRPNPTQVHLPPTHQEAKPASATTTPVPTARTIPSIGSLIHNAPPPHPAPPAHSHSHSHGVHANGQANGNTTQPPPPQREGTPGD